MNDAGANLPAPAPATTVTLAERQSDQPLPSGGWSGKKTIFFIVLAVIVHVALIFAFGTKKPYVPKAVTNVPQLQLAYRADELLELDNPALFALPNPRDFSSAIWQKNPEIPAPAFRYDEAPRWLGQPVTNSLGAIFSQFMATNRFGDFQLDFKPAPPFATFSSPFASTLPQHSTLQISGELARRTLLLQPGLPSLEVNDVIAPSRVQVLVDQMGEVVSTVLLPTENSLEAAGRSAKGDTNAVVLARGLKFAPAPQLAFGEVIFYWHTVPLRSTNTLSQP